MHRAEHLYVVFFKIRPWKDLLVFSGLQARNNKNVLSVCLAGFMEKNSIVFLLAKFKAEKTKPNNLYKEEEC